MLILPSTAIIETRIKVQESLDNFSFCVKSCETSQNCSCIFEYFAYALYAMGVKLLGCTHGKVEFKMAAGLTSLHSVNIIIEETLKSRSTVG